MKGKIHGKTSWRLIVIIAAVIVIIAGMFLLGAGRAKAASPPYTNFTEYPTNPVYDPTERVYYPSILFDGATYRMWYDNGSFTHYSTSADGIIWTVGIATTGLNAASARHPHVEKIGSNYRIWYWDDSVSIYGITAIRTAESANGINWINDQAVTQVGTTVITSNPGPDWNAGTYGVCDVFYNAGGSATITVPTSAATVWANKFVIYYDGTNGGYEDIGVAVSADGVLWQGYNGGAAPVLAHAGGAAWDSNYATFSTVLNIGGSYCMWYSGGQTASHEGIGYATSADGLVWTKDAGNPFMHYTDGVPWRSVRTYTPMVIYDSAKFSGAGEAVYFKMWFSGANGVPNYAMGYASIAEPAPTPTPATVGGKVHPVDKSAILMPYIGILVGIVSAAIIGGVALKKLGYAKIKSRR